MTLYPQKPYPHYEPYPLLTDVQCKNAVCPANKKQARFADSGGMYLQVGPVGSKRWFLKYRIDGKEKQLALGSYPADSLFEARDASKLKKSEGSIPCRRASWTS